MPAQFIIILVLGLLSVLLVVVLLVLIIAYSSMTKKIHYIQRENTFLKNHAHEQSVEVLDEARKRAMSLLEEAEVKAKEMIQAASSFDQNVTKMITGSVTEAAQKQATAMDKITQTLVAEYAGSLESTEKEDIQILQNVSKGIESAAVKEIEGFEKQLADDTALAEKSMIEHVMSAQGKVENDVIAYKQAKMKKVDDELITILGIVSEDVFGKIIPLQDHHVIVMDALKRAKSQLAGNTV